jgi:hypothetical protein
VLTDTSAVAAAPITEDQPSNVGETVASLFGGRFSDTVDQVVGGTSQNTFVGIAIVANGSEASKGAWQYHNGSGWVDIGSASTNAAVLLNAGTSVRFAPAQDFSGQAPTLTVHLVESGGPGFTDGTTANLSSGNVGGATRYSADTLVLNQFVTPVNEAPSITLPSEPAVSENAVNVALADTIHITDVDGDPQTVTLTAMGGTVSVSATNDLLFSGGSDGTNDGTMIFSGSLDNVNAALDSLTFTPTPNTPGPASIQIATNDGKTGTDSDTLSFTIQGGPSCCIDHAGEPGWRGHER